MSTINPEAVEKSAIERKYMYWIHCVRCFEIYIHKNRVFLLLACHHICCVDCAPSQPTSLENGTNVFRCLECNRLVRGRELNNMMPADIKELFHPKPYLQDLPNARVVNFQQQLRQHFISNMIRVERNINKVQRNMDVTHASAKSKFEKFEATRHERKRLERRVHQIIAKRKIQEQKRFEREEERKASIAAAAATAAATTTTTAARPAPSVATNVSSIRFATPLLHSTFNSLPRPVGGRGTFLFPHFSMTSPHIQGPYAQEIRSFAQKRNFSFRL